VQFHAAVGSREVGMRMWSGMVNKGVGWSRYLPRVFSPFLRPSSTLPPSSSLVSTKIMLACSLERRSKSRCKPTRRLSCNLHASFDFPSVSMFCTRRARARKTQPQLAIIPTSPWSQQLPPLDLQPLGGFPGLGLAQARRKGAAVMTGLFVV
jgi:hypothetical protein